MHPQREFLIPAAAVSEADRAEAEAEPEPGPVAAAARGKSQQQQQAAAWKRKKSSTKQSFPRRTNRLIENFSEYLATRNVINNNNPTRQYDKLVSPPDFDDRSSSSRWSRPLNYYDSSSNRQNGTKKLLPNKQQQQTRRKTKPLPRCPPVQRRTVNMLGALLSPATSKSSKKSLLLELSRAPTVLAALFSLLLIVTLIVLYALSFSHHPGGSGGAAGSSPDTPATRADSSSSASSVWSIFSLLSSSSNHVELPAEKNPAHHHRISSRDLPHDHDDDSKTPQTTNRIALQQKQEQRLADSDDDYDANGDEQNELPEGLGRALSVQTECGLLVGSAEDNGVVFRQIPYASPPIGERRWQRPRPIWLDQELCDSSSPAPIRNDSIGAAQRRDLGQDESSERGQTRKSRGGRRSRGGARRHCAQLNPITNRFAGQEDCLYLDIYLPRLDQTERLPVMVYIHGGFLAFGSGSGAGSDRLGWMKAAPSARLAAELNVIVVAFNYRLQALGFMTLPQLASAGSSPKERTSAGRSDQTGGNFGLWDQLTALNWIKRNIESFGGDPDNIVLFGPDSASSLVWALVGRQQAAARELVLGPARPQSGWPQLRNLFRAAWLTNPTVFYDLPYELASEHYQRLFQNQSACLKRAKSSSSSTTTKRDNLRDCLMQLGAEQVMRHYLGNDHPSYRLDDQNSLPIHGIFVDQFVTIDGELVRDSFPFKGQQDTFAPPAASQSTSECGDPTNAGSSIRTEPNNETNLPESSSSLQPPPRNLNETVAHYAKGSAVAATANKTNEIRRDRIQLRQELGSHTKQATDCDSNHNRAPGKQQTRIELLIGSSAQAVEQWPCPRNLNQWTWDDFKRYVATSLNSFATDLYREASSLYDVPLGARAKANNAAARQQQQQPATNASRAAAWTYLTMVSDIRQICPINELVDKLRQGRAAGLSVHRYIVESSSPTTPLTMSTNGADDSGEIADHHAELDYLPPSGRPKFAYHTKELAAFFGYEFEPTFRPQLSDLKFQTKIRQMVSQFVHKQPPWSSAASSDHQQGKQQTAILDENGATRYADKYRDTECSMWRRHLGKSYAWIS